jgi:phosphatidate phosphatase APP1
LDAKVGLLCLVSPPLLRPNFPSILINVADIDDTIKVTKVRDRLELLKYTFALPSEPVAGTESFYNLLNSRLQPAWFYLSASPYNLFPTLTEFIKNRFPRGQLLLREMSWQELDSFIFSLTVGTQHYKEKELQKLMNNLPGRKWVFIGDSTQKDPESYAATYRKHPDKVKRIWIRVVKGVNEVEEARLNAETRWAEAFKGVPDSVWRTFEDVGELEKELDGLEA